jgi:hypothetical protein
LGCGLGVRFPGVRLSGFQFPLIILGIPAEGNRKSTIFSCIYIQPVITLDSTFARVA